MSPRLPGVAALALVLALLLSLFPSALPAQAPTPPFTGTITTTANVRSGPGTTYPVVGRLATGATVAVRQCNDDCTWYLVGNQQWVSATLIVPAPQAAPTLPASTLGAVDLNAADPTAFVHVTWNAGLDDATLAEIAAQLAAFGGVDLWTIQEARGTNVAATLEAAAEAGESAAFASVLGTTGADIKLLTLYNDTRFDLLGAEELHAINTTGNARAPLVLHLRDSVTGVEFLLMNNHLYRSREAERDRQATLLNEWAKTQTLPILAGGDYNFDYDVPDGPASADRGFANMTAGGVWEWARPAQLVPTQCTDNLPCTYDDILDFVFAAGPARDWAIESRVVVRPGDQPDTGQISDHRPVVAVVQPTGAGAAALLPAPTLSAMRAAPTVAIAPVVVAPAVVAPVVIAPTATPVPAPAPVAAAPGALSIVGLDKRAEYAVIRNDGGAPVDLAGWTLLSEKGAQACPLGGVIQPGESLTISALGDVPGYNCAFGSNIWNNSERDVAILIAPDGAEVSRYE